MAFEYYNPHQKKIQLTIVGTPGILVESEQYVPTLEHEAEGITAGILKDFVKSTLLHKTPEPKRRWLLSEEEKKSAEALSAMDFVSELVEEPESGAAPVSEEVESTAAQILKSADSLPSDGAIELLKAAAGALKPVQEESATVAPESEIERPEDVIQFLKRKRHQKGQDDPRYTDFDDSAQGVADNACSSLKVKRPVDNV
jgi:hypothetical protein